VQQDKRQRACLFCGDALTGVRSLEHVFPLWLLKELGISDQQVSAVHLFRSPEADSSMKVLGSRGLALENIKEGRICEGCNNGWMSDLEHSCREVILSLVRARRAPEQLSQEECLSVARWAAKTAFVLNSSANYTAKVPAQHLRELHATTSKLPWGVVVVAATGPFVSSAWIQTTRWQLCAPDPLTSRIANLMDTRSYKIGLHLGYLLLLVIWHSIPGWRKMLWSGQHTALWPWRGKCGWHDDNASILGSLGAEMILPVHLGEVKLVHHRYLAK